MSAVVEIENLVKRYKELVAVDHFNLRVGEGEILGLLGPNASGKTTIIQCALSLLPYDRGTIHIFGREMKVEDYELKAKIGVVPQNIAVIEELTVYENIDYFCGLYIQDKEKRKEYVKEAAAFAGLEGYEKVHPPKLSEGIKRRLNIACGIAHKPQLIFFDEPTAAIDPKSRNQILQGITELNRQGATIIYTSHYMEEVEQICTRIAIVDKGRNIAEGSKEKLKKMLKNSETIAVEIPDIAGERLDELKGLPCAYEVSREDGWVRIKFSGGNQNLFHVLDYLREHDVLTGRVYTEQPTLNDVFLEMTGREMQD